MQPGVVEPGPVAQLPKGPTKRSTSWDQQKLDQKGKHKMSKGRLWTSEPVGKERGRLINQFCSSPGTKQLAKMFWPCLQGLVDSIRRRTIEKKHLYDLSECQVDRKLKSELQKGAATSRLQMRHGSGKAKTSRSSVDAWGEASLLQEPVSWS